MLTFTAFTAISAYGMIKSICKTRDILQRKKEYLENIVSSDSIESSEIIPNKPFILKHVVPQTMMAPLPLEYELYQDIRSNKMILSKIEQYPIPPKKQIDPVPTEHLFEISGHKRIYKDNTLINLVQHIIAYPINDSFGVTFLGQPMKPSLYGILFDGPSVNHLHCEHLCYPYNDSNLLLIMLGFEATLTMNEINYGLKFLKENVGYIHIMIYNLENQIMYFDVQCRDNVLEYIHYGLCLKRLADIKFGRDLFLSKFKSTLILVNYVIVGAAILKYLVKK